MFFNMDQHSADGRDKLSQNLKNIQGSSYYMYGKRWFCLELPFLINFRTVIMDICEPCEQFKGRIKQWNYTHGFTDPLPYMAEMIKNHKHLFFEERRMDGVDCSTSLLRCLKCNQLWELFTWEAVGQLELKPHFPKHHPST